MHLLFTPIIEFQTVITLLELIPAGLFLRFLGIVLEIAAVIFLIKSRSAEVGKKLKYSAFLSLCGFLGSFACMYSLRFEGYSVLEVLKYTSTFT